MHKKIKSFLEGKDYIHKNHLTILSDEAKDYFLKQHEDLGFFKCSECSYYCSEDKMVSGAVCIDCSKKYHV